MTNKKIVFNLTLKDLKDLLLINKKLKKSKKKKNKKKKINDAIRSSSDHMVASSRETLLPPSGVKNNFNNSNNLMVENLRLQNEALKNHQLVIKNEDATKINPMIRPDNNFDEFKIQAKKYKDEMVELIDQPLLEMDEKINDFIRYGRDELYRLDKELKTTPKKSREINESLHPQNKDSSNIVSENVVATSDGSDSFLGENNNPNPPIQQFMPIPLVREEIKRGRGRPKKIVNDEETTPITQIKPPKPPKTPK